MDNVHELKTWEFFMMDIATGKKSFEVRKNDRDFHVGEILCLKGWDNINSIYTGKQIDAEIIYILSGGVWGIKDGYVVMGIKVFNYNF